MVLATTFWETFFLLLIFLPLLVIWAGALLDIFRRDDMGGVSKALWVATVILVPFFGTLIYLIARPSGATPEERAMIEEASGSVTRYSPTDTTAQLSVLAELHDRGKLTDQEFASEKARVMGAALRAPDAPEAPRRPSPRVQTGIDPAMQVPLPGAESIPSEPPTAASRSARFDRPAPCAGPRGVESPPVVLDSEPKLVVAVGERDVDGGIASRVLGRVLEGLQAAEVHRQLDLLGVPAQPVGRHAHRNRRAPHGRAQSRGEAVLREHLRIDAARDALQLGERRRRARARAARRSAARPGGAARPRD